MGSIKEAIGHKAYIRIILPKILIAATNAAGGVLNPECNIFVALRMRLCTPLINPPAKRPPFSFVAKTCTN